MASGPQTQAEGRGNLACHSWEPLHGSSVAFFFVSFLPLGVRIRVLCLSCHLGVEPLFHRLISRIFFLLESSYLLQASVWSVHSLSLVS